jgi:hypothetical protein
MSVRRFKVWSEDEPEGTEWFPFLDAEDAATRVAERRWNEGDYPDEQTFYVRDTAGVLTKWTVAAEETISFVARRAERDTMSVPVSAKS